MRINNNIMAMNTYRQLGMTGTKSAKSMEKLSSGFRINRAGDDAAGLAISEKMRGQIRGLNQASRNAQDGISMIQTAEGALQETEAILQRMRELAVQASNDTNTTEDRQAVGNELVALKEEIDRISSTTTFNGKKLLNGDLSTKVAAASAQSVGDTLDGRDIDSIDVSGAKSGETYTFTYDAATDKLTITRGSDSVSQAITLLDAEVTNTKSTYSWDALGIKITFTGGGTDADTFGAAVAANGTLTTDAASSSADFLIGANAVGAEKLTVAFDQIDTTTLGSGGASDLADVIVDNTAVDTSAKADALVAIVDDAIQQVSDARAKFGAVQNRLEHSIKNLDTSAENLQAAESRIRDVDMAKEMMEFTKNNILQQAAQAMLAQANQAPQGVLQLLR